MAFDKELYARTKYQVVEKIKKTHNWETTEGFIEDGLIAPDIYEKQQLKIICFLGESYGYDECGSVDIETQLEKNILGVGTPKRQTSTKIPALLWLIFESIEKKLKLGFDQMPCLLSQSDQNTNFLQSAVSRAGWINVKKASRHIDSWGNDSTRQNKGEIYRNAIKNKDVLTLQIESTSPDLMIVCSDPVFNSLYDMQLLGAGIERNRKYQIQINQNGQRVIQVNHPSYYRDWGYEGIYRIFESIYDSL